MYTDQNQTLPGASLIPVQYTTNEYGVQVGEPMFSVWVLYGGAALLLILLLTGGTKYVTTR